MESRRGRSGRRWLVEGSTLDGFGRGKLASDSRDWTFRRFGVFGWLPKRNVERRVVEEEKVKLVLREEIAKHEIRLLEKDGGQVEKEERRKMVGLGFKLEWPVNGLADDRLAGSGNHARSAVEPGLSHPRTRALEHLGHSAHFPRFGAGSAPKGRQAPPKVSTWRKYKKAPHDADTSIHM